MAESWFDVEETNDPRIVKVTFKPFDGPPPPPKMAPEEALTYAIAAMHGGESDRLGATFAALEDEGRHSYRRMLEAAAECDLVHETFRTAFHLNWVVRSHYHREHLDDDALFIRALRRIFPPYAGDKLTLYRGEQAAKFDAGQIGLNWSPNREVGLRFAHGLCTCYEGGGVLLRAEASPQSIITGPNDHSLALDEAGYIVEPALLSGIEELGRFPFVSYSSSQS